MGMDPRTPVLVGTGIAAPVGDDPTRVPDVVGLMVQALRSASADAIPGERRSGGGCHLLLEAIEDVAVPQGTWGLPDPGRMVAAQVGAPNARTALYEIGVLQQELFDDACRRIASGEIEVAAVTGGEARHRSMRARSLGLELAGPDDPGAPDPALPPDRTVRASALGVHDLEIVRNAVNPATSYALVERALSHALGRSPDSERAALGALWEAFAAVATGNPCAWDRSKPSAAAITTVSPENRMISTPYTKLLCSQWNVDQAAALIFCSAGAAERFGIDRRRWVFPHAGTVANHSLPVLQRRDLHRCIGAELAGPRVLELAGVERIEEVDHLDFYSCFPSAVQVLADAFGLRTDPPERPLTVTGGLTFGGGPLNNYVLGALATMAPLLRAAPDSRGLVSSVSGFLVKQGFSVWSATAPEAPWRHQDLTQEVARHPGSQPLDVVADHEGQARIASWTVAYGNGAPPRAVVVADVDAPGDAARSAPRRTIGSTEEPAVCEALEDGRDWIGESIQLRSDGTFTLRGPALTRR